VLLPDALGYDNSGKRGGDRTTEVATAACAARGGVNCGRGLLKLPLLAMQGAHGDCVNTAPALAERVTSVGLFVGTWGACTELAMVVEAAAGKALGIDDANGSLSNACGCAVVGSALPRCKNRGVDASLLLPCPVDPSLGIAYIFACSLSN